MSITDYKTYTDKEDWKNAVLEYYKNALFENDGTRIYATAGKDTVGVYSFIRGDGSLKRTSLGF